MYDIGCFQVFSTSYQLTSIILLIFEAHVIYQHKEQQETQEGSLGPSTWEIFSGRLLAIVSHQHSSISKEGHHYMQETARDSHVTKFGHYKVVVNSVKSLRNKLGLSCAKLISS